MLYAPLADGTFSEMSSYATTIQVNNPCNSG
jgi:hypothetical protein